MNSRLYLIDGHALIFKMYYAFLRRPMVNSKGVDTSILFGFTKYLLEMIEREKPTHLAVAFDPPGGTFRNELYPEYKGTRPPTPQLIIDALEPLTEIVKAMKIPVLMVPGFEADDVIGSMAVRSAREGMDVWMVTPDKDYGQLIAPHIFQLKPGKAGGEDELVDVNSLCEKWGILDPIQIIDMLAICGDASDNVPGVKGVGEVGAGKLISRYGSVENIYAHITELSPRQQDQFEEARGHIRLSKTLVTIKTDIPLETTADDMLLSSEYTPELADLFEKYEFNSLRRFLGNVQPSKPSTPSVSFEWKEASVPEVLAAVKTAGEGGLIVESGGEGVFAPPSRIIVSSGQAVATSDSPEAFRTVLEDPAVRWYGTDLKKTANILAVAGVSLKGPWRDIALMHYLVNPERSHSVEILAKSYLGVDLETPAPETPSLSLFDEVAEDEGPAPRSAEAAVLLPLGHAIEKELSETPAGGIYDSMEEPLSRVLSEMERTGVKVDLGGLRQFTESLREEISTHEARARELAGEPELNVASPKQVGEVLFDKLKLDPKAKKNARGQYSTDETTLLDIASRHPVVDEILEYRAARKLLSTYIEPFPSYISPRDGRVHTTFNQALTSTGRLSSSNPNLQNIPIRTERGRLIRGAFVPATPDGLVMSADYSQIELRIMAHLSCDAHLIGAFRSGEDVHAATAAKISGKPISEVTPEERRIAKTANFGIMYGISSFGLAQRLRISRRDAKTLIDGYFESFPAIRSFIDDSIGSARENGYAETLFGRRRYIPDITSKNGTVRALAERNAVNAPIQGTAADIIKMAMIEVDRRMKAASLKSRMVLQIHDELLFDVVPEEVETLKALVKDAMEGVVKLSVPLTVEVGVGKNWLEAH